jgi:hypothetical protein
MTIPDEPVIVQMARAFEEEHYRDVTDHEGNSITWDSQTAVRQRHVLICMAAALGKARELTPAYKASIDLILADADEEIEKLAQPAEEQRRRIRDILNREEDHRP